MKTLRVVGTYKSIFVSDIDVPDDLSFEEAIEYAEAHMDVVMSNTLKEHRDNVELKKDLCEIILE